MSKKAATTKFGALLIGNELINLRFTANAVWTTDDAATRMKKKQEVVAKE